GQSDAGSTTTGSSFLPSTPPLSLISLIAIKAVSFSEVSEIAIVPDNECRIPTLIVSPLSATLLSAAGASAFSADFEHPVNATAPAMVAAKILFENKLRWNIRFFSKLYNGVFFMLVLLYIWME